MAPCQKGPPRLTRKGASSWVVSCSLASWGGDGRTVDDFVFMRRPPGSEQVPPAPARRPGHHHEEVGDMTQRQEALLAEHPRILHLQHGIGEHPRRPDEIDAVGLEILDALLRIPLDHDYVSGASFRR